MRAAWPAETMMSEPGTNLPVAASSMARGHLPLPDDDRAALEKAFRALEQPSLATKVAGTVGRQLGSLVRFLPPGASTLIDKAATAAIKQALTVAVRSLDETPPRDSRWMHRALAVASGAAGGLFGLGSVAVELPVSTLIILRSIADIARNEGEELSDPQAALACLEVFAIGTDSREVGVMKGGYFATRALLAKAVGEAGQFVAANGVADASAPVLVRLISQIGSRFGVVVSEKVAAQAVPLIGAAAGAAVNYAFTEHFQALAFGHFTVRRLERQYGHEAIRAEYDRMAEAALA